MKPGPFEMTITVEVSGASFWERLRVAWAVLWCRPPQPRRLRFPIRFEVRS